MVFLGNALLNKIHLQVEALLCNRPLDKKEKHWFEKCQEFEDEAPAYIYIYISLSIYIYIYVARFTTL